MSDKTGKTEKQPPDPRHAEAQLYQRMEQARVKIYGLINQATRETGLPTAIILEVLRGVIAETTLALERTAHGQVLNELEALKRAGAKGAETDKEGAKP